VRVMSVGCTRIEVCSTPILVQPIGGNMVVSIQGMFDIVMVFIVFSDFVVYNYSEF
jgi:hypothetical protein